MSLSFVHTADWHLGRIYRRLGPRSYESSRWRLDAVRKIWDLAAEKKADFILVAGDVFDSDTPGRDVMRAAVELLRDAPAPVYLISGNHDPCAEGSVWHHPDFADALKGVRNVHLATAAQALPLCGGDITLFPCPVTARHTRDDLTAWIPAAPRGGQARIGLAHGGWKGYYSTTHEEAQLNAIDNDCADRCGLDYLALGDYHSHTLPDHPAARSRTYYAGTPECGASDDARPGYALVVRLDEPGAQPHVEPHFVGRVKTHDWNIITLCPGDGLDLLAQKMAAIEDPENALVRAKIRGCLSEAEMQDLNQWLNEAQEKLLGADIDIKDLCAEPTEADFAALRLEAAERRILQMLDGPLDSAALTGVRDADFIAAWSGSEAARREARTLFYQLLRENK